jgi:hypothetical protein
MRPWEPISLAAAGFAVSAVISTVVSISPRTSFFGGIESLAGLTTVLSYLVILLAARRFVTDVRHANRLLTAAVIAAGATASYAILQVLRLDPYPWEQSSSVGGFVRPFSTLAHANTRGGYLVTALPLVGYFAFRSTGIRRALAVLIAIDSVAAIGLTLTRSAWLALAAITAMGVITALRNGHLKRVTVGVGLAAVVVVIWLLFTKWEHVAVVQKGRNIVLNVWEGIKSLWKMDHKFRFFIQTLLIWGGYFCYFYVTFYAFDFTRDLGVRIGLLAFTMSSLGVAVPVQGGIGVWHFMVWSTLVCFGVAKTDAATFAFVVYAIQTIWIVILGLVSIVVLPIINKAPPPTPTKGE